MNSISKSSKNQILPKKTLDVQHNIKMQQFIEKESRKEELNNKLRILNYDYDIILNSLNINDEDKTVQLINAQDEILNISKQLESLETNSDEIEYLVNTGNILFKYYDIVDKGINIDDTANDKAIGENSILKYLLKPQISENPCESINKAGLLEKYMSYTETNYVKNTEYVIQDKCACCSSSNRNVILNDGIIYCNECHTVEYILIDHDRPSYKDPPKEISYFAYKRINHFNEFKNNINIWLIVFHANKYYFNGS